MGIDEMTLGELKEINKLFDGKEEVTNMQDEIWEIGKKYLIRTVTMIEIGELIMVSEKELILKNASWVADTGRYYNALKTGALEEVEPYINKVIVGRGSIVDATIWDHELPKEQK